MPVTLSALYTPRQKERLREAVQLRASVRAYSEPPSAEEFAVLAYAAGRFAMPGARLHLMRVDEAFFTGTLLGMRRITGCTMAAALIIRADEPHARLHAGILCESFVLEATAMGLGTCWVSGSYRKKLLALPLSPDEAVLCIIALGRPTAPLQPPQHRRRKHPDQLCRGDRSLWPAELQLAAELVSLAPSAMNMQPWLMWLNEENDFVLDAGDRSLLDAGIALCHAELALETPHVWHFGTDRNQPVARAEAK
jgi:nitroreductase